MRVHASDFGMRQQRGELLAVATPQFDDSLASPECPPDRGGVPLQQLQLGSRDAIPRQVTDRVEQRRAERVVQESRRQLPGVQLQVEAGGPSEIVTLIAGA